MHRLRRDPLRDISRKSKPPSAWIQGRNTRHSVRCVRERTNKCRAIELHQVSRRLTRHSSETSWRGLVVYQMGNTATTTMEGRQARKTVQIEEVVRSAFMTPPLFALGTMHTDRCSPARSISRLARTKAVVTLHGLMNSIHRGDHLDLLPRGALKLQWASLGGMDITFKVPAALRVDTLSTWCKDDRKSSALFPRGCSADAIRTKHILCEYLPGRIRCSVPRAHCLSGLGAHFAMSVNLFVNLFFCVS